MGASIGSHAGGRLAEAVPVAIAACRSNVSCGAVSVGVGSPGSFFGDGETGRPPPASRAVAQGGLLNAELVEMMGADEPA